MLCPQAQYQVMPHAAFLDLLHLSKESVLAEPLTMQQLFVMVREYIKRHQLFDIRDASVVHCRDDPLGRLFGVESFTVHNVLQLMSENVDAVDADGVNTGACKLQKLSSVCRLDTKALIDSMSDVVTSTSSLLSDDAGDCMHQTVSLLPNPDARSVAANDRMRDDDDDDDDDVDVDDDESETELQNLSSSRPSSLSAAGPDSGLTDDVTELQSLTTSSASSILPADPSTVSNADIVLNNEYLQLQRELSSASLSSAAAANRGVVSTSVGELTGLYSPMSSLLSSSAVLDHHAVLDLDELSDVETIYSVQLELFCGQSKVTDLVKDSTDDLWFLESTTDDDNECDKQFSDGNVFANELDLVSDGDDVADSDSESDSILPDEDVIIICESESDLEFFADCEDSDIDDGSVISDEELTEADKWVCPVCENENKPLHRCCDFCWSLRPDWLPSNSRVGSRPMTDKHGNLPRVAGMQSSLGLSFSDEPVASLDSGIMSPDSCDVSPDTDEPNPASPTTPEIPTQSVEIPASLTKFAERTLENEVAAIDTEVESLNSDLQCKDNAQVRKSFSFHRKDLSEYSGTMSMSVCVICMSAPKNASIVHGTTGHQACCFHCARQLKYTGKPCPVCRRPINKVIRNYIL